jgi:hypothetical protein
VPGVADEVDGNVTQLSLQGRGLFIASDVCLGSLEFVVLTINHAVVGVSSITPVFQLFLPPSCRCVAAMDKYLPFYLRLTVISR